MRTVTESSEPPEVLTINLGPLTTSASLRHHTAPALRRFNSFIAAKRQPEVWWDFHDVMPGRIDIASLTAFLATAHRLRSYTSHAPRAHRTRNPNVLSFFQDTNFLKLLADFNLLRWEDDLGDYIAGTLNRTTKIIAFPPPTQLPPVGEEELGIWKEQSRSTISAQLQITAGLAFSSTRRGRQVSQRLIGKMIMSTAELIVNSHLHGNATAFVGVQNLGAKVRVSVSDSGVGFLEAMRDPRSQSTRKGQLTVQPTSHLEALLTGSLVNADILGLRRIISEVVVRGGGAMLSSFDADVVWRAPLWHEALEAISYGSEPNNVLSIPSWLGRVKARPSADDWSRGYLRQAREGLRGARVVFEFNLSETGEF
jgi:hypothetical protein